MTEIEIRRKNSEAKRRGAFQSIETTNKNKAAETYYRQATDKEIRRFLDRLFFELSRVYTTVSVENAAEDYNSPKKRKPSVASVVFIVNLFKGKMLSVFSANVEKIVMKYLSKATKEAKRSLQKSMEKEFGRAFRLNWTQNAYEDTLRLMIRRNVSLITNATAQTLSNVENIVYDAMTTGTGWEGIEHALHNQRHISSDRIKRIARDQTAKTNAALNYLEQKSAGIEFFEWSAIMDNRVSRGKGGHAQLNGKIYKWGDDENYPVIDSYGNRGLPSQRVNCRCTALAVILKDGWEMRQNADGTYTPVKIRD